MYCMLTAVQFNGRVYRNVHNTDCACKADACILPNTRHWPNAGSILVHSLLRWPNIESALCERSVLAGYDTWWPVYMYSHKCVS